MNAQVSQIGTLTLLLEFPILTLPLFVFSLFLLTPSKEPQMSPLKASSRHWQGSQLSLHD